MISLHDYTIMVDEMEFLQHPAKTLNDSIVNLTDFDNEQKDCWSKLGSTFNITR
jgi:hypothetical protein